MKQIEGSISAIQSIEGGLSLSPSYSGDYNVVPSDEVQVLPTKGTNLSDNITIQAIPSNYGKIIWNGSFLTVQ